MDELRAYFKSLGMVDKEIDYVLSWTRMRNIGIIKARVSFYKSFFGISDVEIRKMILREPTILGLETGAESGLAGKRQRAAGEFNTSVPAKIEAYKTIFQLTDAEVKEIIIRNPILLAFDVNSESDAGNGASKTSVKAKISAYKEILKLSDEEIRKIILRYPPMLGYDLVGESETSVKGKIKAYQQVLGVRYEDVIKLIVEAPAMLGYDVLGESETSVKNKIKAYTELLNVSDEKAQSFICRYPALLHYDVIGEGPRSIRGKLSAYKSLLNLGDDEVRKIVAKHPTLLFLDTGDNLTGSLRNKMSEYRKLFKIESDEDVVDFILKAPILLELDVYGETELSVKGKIKAYREILHLSDAELRKMILLRPKLLLLDVSSDSETSVKSKIEAYKEILNISAEEARGMIIKFSALLNYDVSSEAKYSDDGQMQVRETSVRAKIRAYKEIFHVSDEEIRKMILAYPEMLGYDVLSESEYSNDSGTERTSRTSVKAKIEAYKRILHAGDDEIRRIIAKNPRMLRLDISDDDVEEVEESKTSVKSKIKAYMQILGMSEEQVCKIILREPSLLSFDVVSEKNNSVKTKVKKLKEIFSDEELKSILVSYPEILGIPAQHFKIRFMMAVNSGVEERFLKNSDFRTNERKVWARLCIARQRKVSEYCAFHASEKTFQKQFGVSSDELMEKYPLDMKAVREIEEEYYKITGQRLVLTEDELAELGL